MFILETYSLKTESQIGHGNISDYFGNTLYIKEEDLCNMKVDTY